MHKCLDKVRNWWVLTEKTIEFHDSLRQATQFIGVDHNYESV